MNPIELLEACDLILKPAGLAIKKRFTYIKSREKLSRSMSHVVFNAGFDAGLQEAVRRLKKEYKYGK